LPAVACASGSCLTGRRQAHSAGQRNVVLVLGDAARMGFLDASFDLVICCFAVHHFERPEEQIGEMVRVCRPGGQVAIIDLVTATVAHRSYYCGNRDLLRRLRRANVPRTSANLRLGPLFSTLRLADAESLGDKLGVLSTRHIVQVLHRGLRVCVAHPLLYASDVGRGDHPGPERVAQVVKAQPAQPAPREGGGIASTQGGAVEACSCDAGEDWIVLSAEALTTSGAIGTERTFPDLGVVSWPPEYGGR